MRRLRKSSSLYLSVPVSLLHIKEFFDSLCKRSGESYLYVRSILRNQIRNEEISRRIRFTDITQRVSTLKWHRAGHIPMDVGVPRCQNSDNINAALVVRQLGRRTTSNVDDELLGPSGLRQWIFELAPKDSGIGQWSLIS
ncbi:jg17209 [Pararge aegeria aegeria]|uniref:Jg17209 protein n=1 Tax=Pararge aegeria aegeria TaxID=348720 RepID=A0A8S4S8C0_9NEOP|nr:jg17209 [Pararge aegeria aegeria]